MSTAHKYISASEQQRTFSFQLTDFDS